MEIPREWIRYWDLTGEPFAPSSPYVPLPSHQEAASRLVQAIETGERLAILKGKPGMGKSRLLRKILQEARGSNRRIALVCNPRSGAAMAAGLAAVLGRRPVGSIDPKAAWSTLERQLCIGSLEATAVVLAVDDVKLSADRNWLDSLMRLTSIPPGRKTLLLTATDLPAEAPRCLSWARCVVLKPLECREVAQYLQVKLAAVGGSGELFSGRAVTRLHFLSGGAPRGIDRLASLSLMAGAAERLEAISSEVVDNVAGECPNLVTSVPQLDCSTRLPCP